MVLAHERPQSIDHAFRTRSNQVDAKVLELMDRAGSFFKRETIAHVLSPPIELRND